MSESRESVILENSLKDYCHNPILLIPVLVSTLFGLLLSYLFLLTQEWILLLPVFLVGVICDIGLVTMSARIATGEYCKLSDWPFGIRKYLWRLLLVEIMVTFIVGFAFGAVGVLLLWSHVPDFVVRLCNALGSSFGQLLGYVSYAAVIIGESGPWTSIKCGWKAIIQSGRLSTVVLVIFLVLNEIRRLMIPESAFQGSSLASVLAAALAYGFSASSIGFSIVQSVLRPLWFLLAFGVYLTFSPKKKVKEA